MDRGDAMKVYLDLVFLINSLVDLFLLLGTNRLTGFEMGFKKCIAAAAFGGLYASVCMLPGMIFLGNILWRIVSLCLMGLIAFGLNRSAAKRSAIFVLLSMALGGLVLFVGRKGVSALALSGFAILALCRFGAGKAVGARRYIPVELEWKQKKLKLIALQDTGNILTDPITGEEVMVAGSDVGEELLGISQQELKDPIAAVSSRMYSGARLIPYHSVGQPGGMLMAVRFHNAKVGNETRNPLVAFAPDVLAKGDVYRILIGGNC